MFIYLCDNGNVRTPEYFEVMRKIGVEEIMQAVERSDASFITSRDKYIEKLYSWYVSNVLMKEKSPAEVLDEVKEVYVKLSYIKAGTQGGITKIDNLLFALQDEIEEAIQYGDKTAGYATGINTIDKATG